MIFLIALATCCITLLGGLFAIRFKDKLHVILGFSAGAVVGVALFDLVPESLSIAQGYASYSLVMSLIGVGFAVYMVLDRIFASRDNCAEGDHHHRGRFGAGSLSFHSFLDGIAIGISFLASPIAGWVVASAVLAHDFSDGINTASLIMRHGGSKKEALRWVILDAVTPLFGIMLTQIIHIPQSLIGVSIAIFAGFFLYIGASDLLPESNHGHSTWWTTVATIFGMLFILIIR